MSAVYPTRCTHRGGECLSRHLEQLTGAELAEASLTLERALLEPAALDIEQLQQDGAQDPDGAWASYAGLSPLEQRHLDGDR